jgi:general secretion pathway protein C
MNINYNSLFKKVIPFLIIIFVAISIDFILYLLLPKEVLEYKTNNTTVLQYKRFEIKDVFKKQKVSIVKEIKQKKKETYTILNNINLLAIYSMDNNDGYIIIQEKNKNDTKILSKNENFRNYKLSSIFKTYVLFTKNNKEYKVSIRDTKKNTSYEVIKEEETTKTIKEISIDDDKVTIKRTLIENYIENFDKIWQDITLTDIYTEDGLDGFKVSRIKPNTAFAKIGLKKGDIIKSINNIRLKSYNDAFKIYKQINTIKSLNIEILRNNIPQEIYYEIK